MPTVVVVVVVVAVPVKVVEMTTVGGGVGTGVVGMVGGQRHSQLSNPAANSSV